MTIHWFPGHMAKARRQIEEKLKMIDLVFELLDARIPYSSSNPMIDQILERKPRIILLNKADLADPKTTEAWIQYFANIGLDAIPIDSTSRRQVQELIPRAKRLMAKLIDKQIARGMKPRRLRALIVGIPNVGKSTLINRLAGRNIAATGDRPGITKAQQWIKVGDEMELLDTPGILWPKFEDQTVGLNLAATGAIREEILPIEEVAYYATKQMILHYGDALMERFGLEQLPTDLDNNLEIVEVMEAIGRRRGCLQSGGVVDLSRASSVILRELRAGSITKISLEHPDELKID